MKSEIDETVLSQVTGLFFKENGPIVFDRELEGQSINDNGQFVVGPWAGPQSDMSNLLHEIGHFGEREIDKLSLFPTSSWGFTFGKYWQIGTHSGYEPNTVKSVLREQRVWAYQLSLLRHFGIDDDPVDLVSAVIYLPAWCYYKPDILDKSKIDALASETDKMSNELYTYEAFMDAWKLRVDYLQNKINKPLLPIFKSKKRR